jgi:hypothetical protein
VAATTAVAAATTTAIRGGIKIVVGVIFAAFANEGKGREQAAYLLAMTFCTNDIICMLMIDQQFKPGFTA